MERDQFILEMQEQTDKMDELVRALKEIVKGAGDTMTKDQFIFEKLGMGCWHEWESKSLNGYNGISCIHCEKYLPLLVGHTIPIQPSAMNNPDFTTWEGFGKLWEAVRKTDWWEEFKISPHPATIHECLINPTPFRDELADFLGWEEE